MGDKIFEDRLRRIAERTHGGTQVELLAGVGEISQAKEAAEPVKKGSLVLAALGATTGFGAFKVLRDQVGIEAMMTLPPDVLIHLATSEPMIGAAAGVLALCAFLLLVSFLRGRKAVSMLSFTGAAIGAAASGAYLGMS